MTATSSPAEPPESTLAAVLAEGERLAISAVVHQNYYMPDVFSVVERIIKDRMQGCAYDIRGLCTRHGSPTRHRLTSSPAAKWPPCLAIDPPPAAATPAAAEFRRKWIDPFTPPQPAP